MPNLQSQRGCPAHDARISGTSTKEDVGVWNPLNLPPVQKSQHHRSHAGWKLNSHQVVHQYPAIEVLSSQVQVKLTKFSKQSWKLKQLSNKTTDDKVPIREISLLETSSGDAMWLSNGAVCFLNAKRPAELIECTNGFSTIQLDNHNEQCFVLTCLKNHFEESLVPIFFAAVKSHSLLTKSFWIALTPARFRMMAAWRPALHHVSSAVACQWFRNCPEC